MQHKIGYIGFGGMAGGYHYDTARRADVPFDPVAVFDIDPDRRAFAESKGLKTFDNLKDFLDSRLFDFVLVATPNQYHCPMVCAALEAGYNAMSEKPVAMSVAEVEKMIAASKKSGKMFTVHHNRRWDRDFMIVKESIENGDIGKLKVVENRIHSYTGTGNMNGWRAFPDHGGGMMVDWGIHVLDQTLYLIQEPIKSVWATIHSINSEEVDDYSKIMITFESGLTAQVEANTFSPVALPKWYIVGDRGGITVPEIDGGNAKVRRVKSGKFTYGEALAYADDHVYTRPQRKYQINEWEEFPIPHGEIPQDWASLYKNVGAALDGTEELVVKPEQVLRCYKVVEAAKKSAQEDITVHF